MPNLAPLVLKDQATTPADHTFTPRSFSASNNEAVLAESTGVPVGDSTVTITGPLVTPKGRYRVDIVVKVPVVQTETINGVSNPKVVKAAYANLSFNFDANSTTQERKDIIAFVRNALATDQAMMQGVIRDLTGLY